MKKIIVLNQALSLAEEFDKGVGVAVEDVRVLAEEQRTAETDSVREEKPVEVEGLVAGDSCRNISDCAG